MLEKIHTKDNCRYDGQAGSCIQGQALHGHGQYLMRVLLTTFIVTVKKKMYDEYSSVTFFIFFVMRPIIYKLLILARV